MSPKTLKRPCTSSTRVSGRCWRSAQLDSEADCQQELLDEAPAQGMEALDEALEALVEQESPGVGAEVVAAQPGNVDDIDPDSMTDDECRSIKS